MIDLFPNSYFKSYKQSLKIMVFQCTTAFVTLTSVNFAELVFFYTQLFIQEPKHYIPNVYAEFQLPSLRLAIFKPKETHQFEFENTSKSGMSLCLEVSDIEEAIAHLNAICYPPVGNILTASHGREIYAYDPDGNRLILHQSKVLNQVYKAINTDD